MSTGARDHRRLWQLGGVLLAAAAIVAALVLILGGNSNSGSHGQAGEPVAGRQAIDRQLAGIPQQGITLGDRSAPVTVVEFGDLQCPVCAAFSATEMPKLVDQYVRPGKVRMEFRTLAFIGPDSARLGRMAAAAARQHRLYQFAELVYANQGAENSGYAGDAYLRRIGGAAGLDVPRALAVRDSAPSSRQLADAARLANISGVNATPTFLVGPTGGAPKAVDAAGLGAELQRLT